MAARMRASRMMKAIEATTAIRAMKRLAEWTAALATGLVGSGTGARATRPAARRFRLAAVLLAFGSILGLSGTAFATPLIVPFDGPGRYGFTQEILDTIDPPEIEEIEIWDYAADALHGDSETLLLATTVSLQQCFGAALGCDGPNRVFDVVWDIELNEDFDVDGRVIAGAPAQFDVNLFLVNWDPSPTFEDNFVSVLYDSLSVDGVATDFEVAQYVSQNTGYRHSFLNIALDGMVAGANGVRQVRFRYEVEGELPIIGGGANLHVPYVGIGAHMDPISAPEPSTGLLLCLALVGFGLNRQRR